VEFRIASVSGKGFSPIYGDTISCRFVLLRRLKKQQRTAIRTRTTRLDTTPPIIGPRFLLLLQASQLINPDTRCAYVPIIGDCSRGCRGRSSDKICISKQVSRNKSMTVELTR